MNQILSVENTTKKKEKKIRNSGGPVEIGSILKFFAISLLIFGVFMIGTGSYAMYKDSKTEAAKAKPVINVSEISGSELALKVTHSKVLSKITYRWNNEKEKEVYSNGKNEIQENIIIPTGQNTLYITAIDTEGEEMSYSNTYYNESGIEIEFSVEGNNIKITTEGEEELSYMTYRWNDDEETKIDINDTKLEELVEIPRGLNTLTVIVVDKNNQTQTKEQEINGVTKPKLEVTTDGHSNFIIKASDEQGLKKVEFIINEEERNMLNLEGRTELEYSYPLHEGTNKLEVTIYNINDVTEVFRAMVRKPAQ